MTGTSHPGLYPPIEPFRTGLLPRPDGAALFWEASGSPDGRPALYLHGGPGGGLGPGGYRRRFGPDRYLVVGLDQRGCGRSRPLAVDHPESLAANTTQALIADLEALRDHLGIQRWLVHGVSWGCTLALAYTLAHPDRVTELVLVAVTTGAREEIDWITQGVGAIFPEAQAHLAALARDGERPVDAVARLLRDPARREHAAAAWDAWESTHISLDPHWTPGPYREDPVDRVNVAMLVTHYWSQDCFLPGSLRIRDRIGELAGIPGVLIHGRRDISGPAVTPWLLHRAWPGSELHIVEEEGHGGPVQMALARQAMDRFAGT